MDPDATNSGEEHSKAGQDNIPDGRVAVYVRISERAREILEAAAKPPRTRATVIEGLLQSYDKEVDPKVRERMLAGENPLTFKDYGDLLELRSWAEHAFLNKRYVWAGGMYQMLAKHPSCTEGLRNICYYRLSLCLIRLSYDVRDEALKDGLKLNTDGLKTTFDLAVKILDKALDHTQFVRGRLGKNLLLPALVLHYNLASCHSLKAQYKVESELDPKSDWIERLKELDKGDAAGREKVWRSIAEGWRQNKEQGDIDVEASKALHNLHEIIPLTSDGKILLQPDGEDVDPSSEKIWLADAARTDEDFIFLRTDKTRMGELFNHWTSSALRDRKPISSAVLPLILD